MAQSELNGRKIIVGVGGGIAAFKAVWVVRELGRRGASVRVVMTEAAQRFVGRLTFAGLLGEPPVTDLWDDRFDGEVHVDMAAWADAALVVPATANLMARAAYGLADDALLATLLCFDGPLVLAPAMHALMWQHPATQANVDRLLARGARFAGPVEGALASGEVGLGRMAEPEAIVDALSDVWATQDLRGRRIVVTAGGTEEDIDPVRFLTNRSSGLMGYALAERAATRGATVVLVSAPTALSVPRSVDVRQIRSALEMAAAVDAEREAADAIIMAAAVADYRPAEPLPHKLKKQEGELHLRLTRNPDILAGLGAWRSGRSRPLLVGFAVETDALIASARAKLKKKRVDLVVANEAAVSFGRTDNQVTLVDARGEEALPALEKRQVADRILDRVVALLARTGADGS